ncbi:uncharacterized protein BXIN_0646 [Babesia sp. Xinjiang]|uniref:uncharacterized protein n=1 Tax=Babesia sp. Xinjiang TaxID=462227 RepID=UPI000A21B8FD|nr:uncharacterized protein BXIN_0646 [Babesia sp. Xinjiang]ORM41874.1 hypothetical protein BXIN_0646 [Babesia sp. Xinjiang]
MAINASIDKSVVGDDEIDKLEKEVRRRLGVVGGLLKLRDKDSTETYKEHFETAKREFDQIAQYIAEVQEKVDRELSLMHQVNGVVRANGLQQIVFKEFDRQIQTSETLQAINELKKASKEIKNKILQRAKEAARQGDTCVSTTKKQTRRNPSPFTGEHNDEPAHNNKRPKTAMGSYSKDRDTFNRYIL